MLKSIISLGVSSARNVFKTGYPIQAKMTTSSNSGAEIRLYEFCDLQESLKEKTKTKLSLVDVREESEVKETGMVPGSIHVPLGQVESALESSDDEFKQKYKANKPQPDDPLIFICRAGRRSYEAAKIAVTKSYSKVGSYKHGFLEWAEKAKELESEEKE